MISKYDNVAMNATRYLLGDEEEMFNNLVTSLKKEEVDEMMVMPVVGKAYMLSLYDMSNFQSFRNSCIKNELIKGDDDSIECTMHNVLLNLLVDYGFKHKLIKEESNKILVIIKNCDDSIYTYQAIINKGSIDGYVTESGLSLEVVVSSIIYQANRSGFHFAFIGGDDVYSPTVVEYQFVGDDIEFFINSLIVLHPIAFDIRVEK